MSDDPRVSAAIDAWHEACHRDESVIDGMQRVVAAIDAVRGEEVHRLQAELARIEADRAAPLIRQIWDTLTGGGDAVFRCATIRQIIVDGTRGTPYSVIHTASTGAALGDEDTEELWMPFWQPELIDDPSSPYLRLAAGRVTHTLEIAPWLHIDYDEHRAAIGVKIHRGPEGSKDAVSTRSRPLSDKIRDFLLADKPQYQIARQVATERGEALDKAKAQRRAALDLCDGANMSDVWFAANIRAALGVCVACGCDLGTTPLCPSCEQSIEASKRERP